LTGGICEVRNRYTLHAGASREALDNPPIMSAKENSSDCMRCCCAPNHNVFVEFRLSEDPDDTTAPIAMTFEREGLFGKCPCCCTCAECCLDSMAMHAGQIMAGPDSAGKLADRSRVFGTAKQALQRCSCTPTIEVFDGPEAAKGNVPHSVIHGPFIFGGCLEACIDTSFPVSRPPGRKIGDMAQIQKLKPRNFGELCTECFQDADRYYVEFRDPSLTPQQKANLIGALLLTDFMFFELDNGMCSCRNKKLTITLFLCYCCGCLCPCQIVFQSDS